MGQTQKFRTEFVNPRTVAVALLAVGFVVMLALNLPGQLSYDSIAQLHDGRTGIYNGWHPPVMAWLLGLADTIVPGTALFVIVVTAIFFGAVASLLWIAPKPTWWSVPVAAVLVLTPQFLIYQGTVWKDVLFADAAISGFVCLAHAAGKWERATLRIPLLIMGAVLLVLAALARQNGVIALAFGLASIGVLAVLDNPTAGLRAFLRYGLLASLGALFLFAAASIALGLRMPGESGTQAQFKLLEDYDLIGALKRDPSLNLDIIARANPDLAALMRSDGVRLYTPERNDTLVTSEDLQNELADTPQEPLSAQWRELLFQHTWTYLNVRWKVFWWTFATPILPRCFPFYVGVQGLPRYMRELGLSVRSRSQDVVLAQYGSLFVGTPVFSHLIYAALAIAMLFVLLRRRRVSDIAMAVLLVSALAFAASFFVISIACDYRYLVFLDLSALVCAFYLAVTCPKFAEMTRSLEDASGATQSESPGQKGLMA